MVKTKSEASGTVDWWRRSLEDGWVDGMVRRREGEVEEGDEVG